MGFKDSYRLGYKNMIHKQSDPTQTVWQRHIGQPIFYQVKRIFYKDFIDAFKPYKSQAQVEYDLLLIVYGIGNILNAILTAFVPLLVAPDILIAELYFYKTGRQTFKQAAENCLAKCIVKPIAALFVLSPLLLLRGVTQIISSPLVWLLKIPLRGIITYKKGAPGIEENRRIHRRIEQIEQQVDKLKAVHKGPQREQVKNNILYLLNVIDIKIEVSIARGQNYQFDPEQRKSLHDLMVTTIENNAVDFTEILPTTHEYQQYKNIFSSKQQEENNHSTDLVSEEKQPILNIVGPV